MSFPFTRNSSGLVVIVNGSSYSVRATHPRYSTLVRAIKTDDEKLFFDNISQEQALKNYIDSQEFSIVKITNGEVLYDGVPVHNNLTKRILEFQQEGLPFEPLLKFMEKLYQNPSSKAVNELFDFLENKNLPITPDGDFLAYKGLKSDYFSVTAGKLKLLKGRCDPDGRIYNGVGEEIECPRNQVDDNRDNECSIGCHIGGLEYATDFAAGKMVIVKCSPTDVVSVPRDCNAQKCRVCHYFVVEDYVQPLSNTLSTQSCDNGTCDCDEFNDDEDDEYMEFDDDNDYESICCDENCPCQDLDEVWDDDDTWDDDDDSDGPVRQSVNVEQIRQNDFIEFIYHTTRENRIRHAYVESTTDTNVFCVLTDDDCKFESDSQNYRNFQKKFMEDIYLV